MSIETTISFIILINYILSKLVFGKNLQDLLTYPKTKLEKYISSSTFYLPFITEAKRNV